MNQFETTLERSPLIEAIAGRRSPKGFLDIPVEPEKLRSILEAARWAPSSMNEQPWRFIVATMEHPGEYERLFSTLRDSNKAWAGQAPVLIASVAKLIVERTGTPNRFALHDVGSAIANLTVQAVSLGLQVHQMGGFDAKRLRDLYHIPDGFEPVSVNAVGYADEKLFLGRERVRKELHALVFERVWGESSGLFERRRDDESIHD